MNPAFEQALQARLLWMQVRSYGSLGFHRMRASEIGQLLPHHWMPD
ncbi:hypothetical protein [Pseudomonas syringae]|nr:hypothetical protein [Pseudomonas syringae]GGJ53097.1 hypothetical protein GCM10009085_53130 [Pseudomonas avellanae]